MEPIDRVQAQIDLQQRQFPALDYRAKAIVGRIVRLNDIFQGALERVTKPFGITPTEYSILTVLRAEGPPYTLSPKAINQLRFNSITSGGMTFILNGLAERRLIERLPDPSDGRGVLIRLSKSAFDLIDRVIEAHVAEERHMIEGLPPKERSVLQVLLTKLLVSLEPVPIRSSARPNATATRAKAGARVSGKR